MKIPFLVPEVIHRGDPYPILIKRPDGTPVLAVADLGPGTDPMEFAHEVCRAVNTFQSISAAMSDRG